MKRICLIIMIATAVLLAGCREETVLEPAGEQKEAPAKDTENSKEEPAVVKSWYVQVCGAVATPGVYELPEGSRVMDAITLAGGITEEAAFESVNQAETVTDGAMIWVLTKREWKNSGTASGTTNQGAAKKNHLINLNRASVEELTTLPGVGEAKADRIIQYREEEGFFTEIEDIMKIDGIKEGVFEKIKDKICVN